MMPSYETYEMKVRHFQRAFNQPIDAEFDTQLVAMRIELMQEEFKEFLNEIVQVQMDLMRGGSVRPETYQAMVKELADLQYVLSGFAVTFGIPLEMIFNRVHASNMSKLGFGGKPVYREDGKVMKGASYKAPDLSDVVP